MGGGRGRNAQVEPQREEVQAISRPTTKSAPIYHKINYKSGRDAQSLESISNKAGHARYYNLSDFMIFRF